MDQTKIGELLRQLRLEQGMTQLQLAGKIGVSDRAVSKWERGAGCPDVGLLSQLAETLGVPIETLLSGECVGERGGGNLRRLKFYVCATCGNVLASTGEAEIICCGRRLAPLVPAPADAAHTPWVERIETEYYLRYPHPMNKMHTLSFVAVVSYDRYVLVRLYPEQEAAVRIPQMGRARLLTYCTQHGLTEMYLP